ncbi:DUF1833 family protein [Paralcaligenes ginsengisoli]
MRTYTSAARRNLLATSADEPFLVMLEITHADLAQPVRVVNDTQNLTSNGNEFIACAFQVTLPDDVDGQIPQAQLSIDNIGRELTQWLEYSRGGQGAKCRIIQVMRSAPDLHEFDMTLDLTNLNINNLTVTGTLGFVNTLGQVGTVTTFNPTTNPGNW